MAGPSSPFYGLSAKYIARVCGVDLSTARRWRRGATYPPKTALMLLSGDLGVLDSAWEGWRLYRGVLISPEGWRATPGDVLSIQLTQAQLSAYRDENRLLKEDLETAIVNAFEEQPTPSQWEIATG